MVDFPGILSREVTTYVLVTTNNNIVNSSESRVRGPFSQNKGFIQDGAANPKIKEEYFLPFKSKGRVCQDC